MIWRNRPGYKGATVVFRRRMSVNLQPSSWTKCYCSLGVFITFVFECFAPATAASPTSSADHPAGTSNSGARTATDNVALGETCLRVRDYHKAAGYFRLEISSHRNNAAAHYGLAKALFLLGRHQDAAQELELAAAADPSGTIGARAREALARRSEVMAQRTAVPATNALTRTRQMRAAVALHAPATPQAPPWSPHMTESHKEWRRTVDEQYQTRVANAREDWQKSIKNYTQARNLFAEGTEEWQERQDRITDCEKSLEADLAEYAEKYQLDCKEINDEAEKHFAETRSAGAVVNVAAKPGSPAGEKSSPISQRPTSQKILLGEREQRERSLLAERDGEVQTLTKEWTAKIAEMEHERDAKAAVNKDDAEKIVEDWNERIAKTEAKYRIRIFELKKIYAGRLAQMNSAAANLNSTQKRNRDDDAQLIPVGKTNLYSRSYHTFGDPSGNAVPLMAEPKALQIQSLNKAKP